MGNWDQALKQQKMISCGNLQNWFVVASERSMGQVQDFIGKLQQAGKGLGFRIANPQL